MLRSAPPRGLAARTAQPHAAAACARAAPARAASRPLECSDGGAAGATRRGAAHSILAGAVACVAAATLSLHVAAAHAEVCTLDGVCVVQTEEAGDLTQILQERSRANKAAYDQRRLDSFYQKDFRLNKLLRADVLPEPCDPRQPEFRTKCLPNGGLLPPEALK